jgi:hypothetical protein
MSATIEQLKASDFLEFPAEVARQEVLKAIDEARSGAGFRPYEVVDLAGLDKSVASGLNDILNSKFSFDDILALTAVLGVEHDRLLPLKKMDEGEVKYWADKMVALDAGGVAASDGFLPLDPNVALALFIRFEALKELFEG